MSAAALRFVAALAFAWLLVAGPVRAEEEAAPPLTEDALRVLLQDAAATPREPLDTVVRLGALVGIEDVLTHGSLPFTLALVVAFPPYPQIHVGHQPPQLLTITDIVPLLEGPSGKGTATLSALRADALKDVEMHVDGPKARGSVSFWFDARLHGRVEWRAEVEGGVWAVTDLMIPGLNQGVTRRGERWFLRAHGAARPASALVVPTASLPQLGLLGTVADHSPLFPDDVLHLTVGILGEIFGPQGRIGLDDVRALNAEVEHALRRRGRVVLRAHAEAPWSMVGWTIDAVRAAEGALKPLELYVAGRRHPRFLVEVDPPDPFMNEGVLSLGRLEPLAHDAPDAVVVDVDPDVGEVPAPTVYRALKEALKRWPVGTRRVLLRVGSEGKLYAGHVLRLADLAVRAGARDVDFAPLPIPGGPHGAEFGPEHASRHMVGASGFRLRIGTTELRGDPPVPLVAPEEWEPAGVDPR